MRYLAYPTDYIFRALPPLGLVDVEVCILPGQDGGDLHPFVMARRAASRPFAPLTPQAQGSVASR